MIQPSEFLIGRDGKVLSATYSTGPIGRLRAEDVLSLVRFMLNNKKYGITSFANSSRCGFICSGRAPVAGQGIEPSTMARSLGGLCADEGG